MAAALPETLKAITATKIEELLVQAEAYENQKNEILKRSHSQKDAISRVDSLLLGACKIEKIRLPTPDSDETESQFVASTPAEEAMRNSQLLLRAARTDNSTPESLVTDIEKRILESLNYRSQQYDHAKLFSDLVTEWLEKPDGEADADTGTDDNFEEVGRKEMHEQRQTWEHLVFQAIPVSHGKINHYLKALFHGDKTMKKEIEGFVKRTQAFCHSLAARREVYTVSNLKQYVQGVMQTKELSDSKTATLKTFLSNKEVLREVCDVLNMRWSKLSTWKWTLSNDAVNVEMRRQLNGKYRVFMDPDVLDSLLLYTAGLKFAVHFRSEFVKLLNSEAWNKEETVMSKHDRARRQYYLGSSTVMVSESVEAKRNRTHAQDYFMTQLPESEDVGKKSYDSDDDDDSSIAGNDTKSAIDLKHGLLHLLVAETQIARAIEPETPHAVLQSDFKWFGPSLPHDSIFAVLQFFGVTDEWVVFFRNFLEVPLRFVHDGPKAKARVRKCGVPMSQMLSDMFGEVLLFVMDVAVNRKTSSNLYRLHDDFWFWGSQSKCVSAWEAMTEFTHTFGLSFNEEKTGSATFGGKASSKLPSGVVKWGFLRLDSTTGRFVVDQGQVDEHIKELRLQLSYCSSVFSYIQAYNAYLSRFFSNNFGRPSLGFGSDHVNQIISTFSRIQTALFPSGSVTNHLAKLIADRFGASDLPTGFFYWPVDLGGLDLRNPIIPLLSMRENMRRSPTKILSNALEDDEQAYTRDKNHFTRMNTGSGIGSKVPADVLASIRSSNEEFMPRAEYMRCRVASSAVLGAAYAELLEVPSQEELRNTPDLMSWCATVGPESKLIKTRPSSTQPYWQWMVGLYGKELMERYGSLRMVDREMIPLGPVSVLKQGKVKWQG